MDEGRKENFEKSFQGDYPNTALKMWIQPVQH